MDFENVLGPRRDFNASGKSYAMAQGRGDEAICRRLSENLTALNHWQSLPLVQFFKHEHIMDLWDDFAAPDEPGEHSDIYVKACKRGLSERIFDESIFYWNDLDVRLWAHISEALNNKTSLVKYFSTKFRFLSKDKSIGQESKLDLKNYLRIYLFVLKDGELGVIHYLIKAKDNDYKTINSLCSDGEKIYQVKELDQYYISSISVLHAYLAQMSKQAVEVRKANPKIPKDSVKGKKKPWLRDDTSRIILMSPTDPRIVYERSEVLEHRKSPTPHERRGHWRTLKEIPGIREKKVVFVRPAWIGPMDWSYKGSVYKVVQERQA